MLRSKLHSGTSFQNKATCTSPPWPAFVLEAPLCNLLTSMCDFVPCDQIVQRAFSLKVSQGTSLFWWASDEQNPLTQLDINPCCLASEVGWLYDSCTGLWIKWFLFESWLGPLSCNLQQIYSVTNSSGATLPFSANHKTSSEQKNRSSFISDQSQMRDLQWKVVYFHQPRDDWIFTVGRHEFSKLKQTYIFQWWLDGRKQRFNSNLTYIFKYVFRTT